MMNEFHLTFHHNNNDNNNNNKFFIQFNEKKIHSTMTINSVNDDDDDDGQPNLTLSLVNYYITHTHKITINYWIIFLLTLWSKQFFFLDIDIFWWMNKSGWIFFYLKIDLMTPKQFFFENPKKIAILKPCLPLNKTLNVLKNKT